MTAKKKDRKVKRSDPVKTVAGKKRSSMLFTAICIGVITLITYFVFSPSLQNGFINWDDNAYVTDNPVVMNDAVLVKKIFETPVASNYHPLAMLTLAWNYQVGKLDPFGYHLVNVILHVLNAILVFVFIFLLTRRNLLMASIVALFFGIHPMHVESVAWVSERKDVLYVFFFMAGLITYLRYSETKKVSWYLFTFLLFILSCLSKGMAVVFPVALLLIDYLRGVKWERRLLVEKIPFFLVAVAVGIIAVKIQAGDAISDMKIFTPLQRLMFASYGAVMYIVKFFVPVKLSVFYPYPYLVNNAMPVVFYISPVILLALIGVVVYAFYKKEKEIVFGLLFYFVAVALVLQFISVGAAVMADRYSYLAYIGLLFVVAHVVDKVRRNESGNLAPLKYLFGVVIIIGAMAFSYQTYARTQVWQNSELLWSDVISKYPDAALAYANRAKYYQANNELDKAMADYTMALQLNPSDFNTYKDTYYNRGLLYTAYGKNNLAIADYTKAIAIYPAYKKAYFNRALLYADENKNDSAIADYTKAIAIDTTFADAYTNRGLLYTKYSNNNLAMADYTKAIALDPVSADAYNDRGLVYLNSGRYNLAITDYNKAIAINPACAPYYYNRGLCYRAIKQLDKALADFTKGIELNPDNAALYLNAKADAVKQLQGK